MIELTACPECGQPAEVLWREPLTSTDRPIEHARVLCISRHGFFVPVETLPAVPLPRPTPAPGSSRRSARAAHEDRPGGTQQRDREPEEYQPVRRD